MNHAFWNAFVIEVGDLLTGVKVLQQSWPSITDCQRIISVINPDALLGGQIADIAADPRRLQISLLPVTGGVGLHVCLSLRFTTAVPDFRSLGGTIVHPAETWKQSRAPLDRSAGRTQR